MSGKGSKKSKSGKRGKSPSKSGSADGDRTGSEKTPAGFIISRQLDQQKIDFLAQRVKELLQSNDQLRTGASQNEKDTYDIVKYFQREMEIKDDIILRLNEELVKSRTQLKFEVEKLRKAFETELLDVKSDSEQTKAAMSTSIADLEKKLKELELFKQEKSKYDEEKSNLEEEMKQQRHQFMDAMEAQERRNLEEKMKIHKELDEEKVLFRQKTLNEARQAMGDEVKKIMAENARMTEEVKFRHSESTTLQAEKTQLISDLSTAKRELNILVEKEIEYAKQAHSRSKEIKLLRER